METETEWYLVDILTPYPIHPSGAEGDCVRVKADSHRDAAQGAVHVVLMRLGYPERLPDGHYKFAILKDSDPMEASYYRHYVWEQDGERGELKKAPAPSPSSPLAELLAVARGAFADGTTDDLDVGEAERTVALRESMAASALVLAEVAAKILAMMESNHV